MIRKMTAIPATAKNSFGTANANMQRAIVRIVEGESTVPAECTPLGICDVELPPFLPKGSPVELTYEYNANQVLEVAVQACGNCATCLDRAQDRPVGGRTGPRDARRSGPLTVA